MSELIVRPRRPRSDRGRARLEPEVLAKLEELLLPEALNRPSVTAVWAFLAEYCREHRHRTPSRATIYNAMCRIAGPTYRRASLPDAVVRTLHNVADGAVPGHQVVFAAFNYGDTRAMSYAAGLPWSCLFRAARLRGWRPKARALLRSVMAYRRI